MNLADREDKTDQRFVIQDVWPQFWMKTSKYGVIFATQGQEIEIPFFCPQLKIDGVWYTAREEVNRVQAGTDEVVCDYVISCGAGRTVKVQVYYSCTGKDGIFRKWAELTPSGFYNDGVLEEVVVERLERGQTPAVYNRGDDVSSYPYYYSDLFAALEFPYARNHLTGEVLTLGHTPSHVLMNDLLYRTKNVVYGLSGQSDVIRRFEDYISRNRPATSKVQTNYNTWWTLPGGYSEEEALTLLSTLKESLYDRYGICFDTFTIDMGWSRPDGIWEINTDRFPDGFHNINRAVQEMGGRLGLWVSPSNIYSPSSFDNGWAKENGYEVIPTGGFRGGSAMCLAGEKYRSLFKQRLMEYVSRYDIMHIKFDGTVTVCGETDHGHVTGGGERELIAESLIDIFQSLSRLQPGIWLEATCFGNNASPFWLLYCSSVLGTFGDDCPQGMCPSPRYRESATSGRDYFNLQGADRLSTQICYQELLGVIHQSDDDFMNDLITVIMRGNAYIPFYLNPKYMTPERWAKLAAVLQWLRENDTIFEDTQVLRPVSFADLDANALLQRESLPAEAYGYAHWISGMVMLRNPFIEETSYTLPLPAAWEGRSLHSIYPEKKDYTRYVRNGKALIPLAPYETLVLTASPTRRLGLPDAQLGGEIVASGWTVVKDERQGCTVYTASGWIECRQDGGQVVFLIEDRTEVQLPGDLRITINGIDVLLTVTGSRDGFVATELPRTTFWQFAVCRLDPGAEQVQISFTLPDTFTAKVSVYGLSSRAGTWKDGGTLPPPEMIHTGSVTLVKLPESLS